jgi:hypothetical protein
MALVARRDQPRGRTSLSSPSPGAVVQSVEMKETPSEASGATRAWAPASEGEGRPRYCRAD